MIKYTTYIYNLHIFKKQHIETWFKREIGFLIFLVDHNHHTPEYRHLNDKPNWPFFQQSKPTWEIWLVQKKPTWKSGSHHRKMNTTHTHTQTQSIDIQVWNRGRVSINQPNEHHTFRTQNKTHSGDLKETKRKEKFFCH